MIMNAASPTLVIWKFEFDIADKVLLEMPGVAKILAVGTQGPRKICVWALVDPESKKEPRELHVRGTGHPVHPDLRNLYIGTVFDGPFVWHVFGQKS